MRPQQAPEPLRFRYRAKLGQHLLVFVAALIFGALLVHVARSGLAAPSRGFARIFDFDPALLWWSAAVLVFGISLFGLRGVMHALGPGKTITLTEDNLIIFEAGQPLTANVSRIEPSSRLAAWTFRRPRP